ncbi:PAS domain S-box protein [Actomonas aquatica]|uniref:PAS domain S-box protein n=1 Tax=Actomonas aquatica TaxID=2866162 RepID=A0ABZ1C2Z8_9BACT|nr:PAS domain S-box protein [Opitutus sp. WL0086]WRQ86082.1 PAS domain S-box protein [Opitutus sp. WL0086]
MTSLAASFGDLPLSEHELITWILSAANAHSIMAVTDAEGVIVYANDQFCKVSGYTREELAGKTHRIIKSDYHPPEFFAKLWSTIKAGESWRGTICNRAKDGSRYWVSSTIMPLLGDDGRPRFFLALRTNVSRLKETEEKLRSQHSQLVDQVELLRSTQSQLTAFYDHAPIGISWREINADGQPGANHVNATFLKIIRLTHEQVADVNNVYAITHPDDLAKQEALTNEIYEGKRDQFTIEKRYIVPLTSEELAALQTDDPDGAGDYDADGNEPHPLANRESLVKTVWGQLTVVVLRNADGQVTHHFGMLADITKQRLATNLLQSREARWRTYLETASEVLYAITPEGRIKFVSSAWTSKLGHTKKDAVGRRFTDYLHPDHVEQWTAFFEDTLKHGASNASIEYRIRHADGRWIWHAMSSAVYSDRHGRTAFLGVGRDITLRLEAQNQLKEALARREEMERIVNRSPSVVVLWRAAENWPVEFVSQSVSQYGYTPEYFTQANQGFIAITHPDDSERVTAEVEAHAKSGHDEYNQEYRIVCADGSVRWVADHTVVRRNAEGIVTHHEGLITDISDRKEAEERERELRERDLRTAATIQTHLRPREFPDIRAVEIEALSHPSLHIGGDYYDVVKVDERRWGFVIADVSGKGAAAALVMTECRATMRLCAEGEPSPAAAIKRVNRHLEPDMRPGMFVALFYGILDLDTKVLRFCRAGHEPPILVRANGEMELLPGEGLAVGLDDGPLFDEMLEEHEVQLGAGDVLALYTDGITEVSNPDGEEFGRDRLAQALERNIDHPLAEIVRTVDRYTRNFCVHAPRHDDTTLLLVRPV